MILPCGHRFCAGCVRPPIHSCPTCATPLFHSEIAKDHQTAAIGEKFGAMVDQAKQSGRLLEGQTPGPAVPLMPRTIMSAEAQQAKAEREAIRTRMKLLEKRLRAHHAIKQRHDRAV